MFGRKRRPVKLEPGMWLKQKISSSWLSERAVVLGVHEETVRILREHQVEPEWVVRSYVDRHFVVMRPTYACRNEKLRDWMVPGTRVTKHFHRSDDFQLVYLVEEVRGFWALMRKEDGSFYLQRARDAVGFTPHLTRFQRDVLE